MKREGQMKGKGMTERREGRNEGSKVKVKVGRKKKKIKKQR